MPVKWTPETDQIVALPTSLLLRLSKRKSPRAVRKLIGLTQLLLKILETSNVNADAKAISAAWPEGQEKPTPRAITERIHRIRSMSKSTGGDSAPSTPRKATASRPQTSEKGEVTGSKRKRGGLKAESSNDDDDGQFIKPESRWEDFVFDSGTPTKKARGATARA